MSGAGRSALAIAVLLPDVLGTYSDAGNAVVLAELRGGGVSPPRCTPSGSPTRRRAPRMSTCSAAVRTPRS